MEKLYVHYGCGFTAPKEWQNFDASPSRFLQNLPFIGKVVRRNLYHPFPPNVKYGNIVKGLPIKNNTATAVYCSHTLEHLSLKDFRIALQNTYDMLEPGGKFKLVVPDLEFCAREYIRRLDKNDRSASLDFMGNLTHLGTYERSRGLKGLAKFFLGNALHLWMWDYKSMEQELINIGFVDIRHSGFGESDEEMFKLVEESYRFVNAVSIECKKPLG